MPFDPTDPNSFAANQAISPLAGMASDRSTGMLNQPQMRRFAPPAPIVVQDAGTNPTSPIMPGQNQINSIMPGALTMAKGGPVQGDELASIKNTIRQEFASRGLDFDRFVSNPAVMDEVGKSIQSQGQNGDTILAHINPKEAEALKRMGGSGTINPHTGLPQFAEDSSSSNQSPSYGGGNYSGYTGGSDIGGYSGSGNTTYSPSTGGTTTSPSMGGAIGGGGGGGGGAALNMGGGSNTVSPTGAGGPALNMGEGQQGAAQTTSAQPSLSGVDQATGMPVGGTSNLSGLGQLATAPALSPGLGTFAPTTSGIGTVPVAGSDTGLSNVAFGDTANMPAAGAAEAAGAIGNVSPGVANYDPVSGNFIDVNGNSFTVDSAGRRQYTSFSTSLPNSPVVTSPGMQSEILPTLQGSKIVPSGIFTASGPAVMQPAPSMIVKEQGQAPAPIQQAAIESPSTSNIVAALDSNNPAAQMDAAMQIMGGAANMFGLTGDVFTTAQTNLSDAAILDRRLAGMEKTGNVPQLGGADLTGMVRAEAPTMTAQAPSFEDVIGTQPQGNYLFSGLAVTDQTIPNMATVNVPKAYELYNPVLAQPEDVYGGLVQKLTGVNPITKQQAIDPETGKPVPPTGTWMPGTTIDPKTGLPTTGYATWSTPTTDLETYNALIEQYKPAMKFTPQQTITTSQTNWGQPGAGLMPDVSSGVSPTTFAGLTPLSEPAPLSMAATGLTIPSPAPATASSGITFPSIISSANAATPDLFSPVTETTFQMPGTVPLPPTRPEEAPLFTGNIPVPTARPANLDAVIAQAPPAVKAAVGTSANPPANTAAPQTEYDKQVAALENADMIANGISKQEYADLMGVPVSEVKTRITSAFGPPMAEYYTKTLFEAFAGMTGGKTNTEGAMNLMSMFSPLGILGLAAKAGYNAYRKPVKKADGGLINVPAVAQGQNVAPQIGLPKINLQAFATPYTGISPDYKPPVAPPPAQPPAPEPQSPEDWLKSKFPNLREAPRGFKSWQEWFKSNISGAPQNIQDWYSGLPTDKRGFLSALPKFSEYRGLNLDRFKKDSGKAPLAEYVPRVRTPMPQDYSGYGGEYSYYKHGGAVSPLNAMRKK